MPEETQKDTKEEVQETPQGEEQPEELSASKDPAEDPTEETPEDELPEGTKERTREQFEKLKKSNAELKAELEQRKQLPSVLDYLNTPNVPEVKQEVKQQYMQPPQPLTQPQIELPQEPQLVDENGYIDADALKRELDEAKQARREAEEARRQALMAQERIAKYEQTSEEAKLYQAYPELDPYNEAFNQDAYELVRNELTSQIVNTGKRDALQAAEKMSKYFRQKEPQNKEVIQQRAQVAPTAGTSSSRAGKSISEMTIEERLKAWEERNNI